MSIINDSGILINILVIIRAFAPFCAIIDYRFLIFLVICLRELFIVWKCKSQIDIVFTIVSEWFFLNVDEIIIIFCEFYFHRQNLKEDITIIDISLDFHRNNYYRHWNYHYYLSNSFWWYDKWYWTIYRW